MKITIVGGGAVAEGLAREFAGEGVAVGRWNRRENRPEELAAADLYILAVSDGAVAEVSRTLPFAPGSVVAHTAGCVALCSISPEIEHGAVIYPLQSFTKGRAIEDFRRTPFFIEGATPHALAVVRRAAEMISDGVSEMSSARRARIHLAGAFANNFSNAMLSLAEMIAEDADENFDALKPIVAETLAKALAMASPRNAQTGAAQRGDRTIQAKHVAMLEELHPELVPLYEAISEQIWKISKRN